MKGISETSGLFLMKWGLNIWEFCRPPDGKSRSDRTGKLGTEGRSG